MKRKLLALGLAVATFGSTFTMMFSGVTVNAQDTQNVGTKYYISSKNGSNQNAGTSEDKPWETLDKIKDLKLKPGDQILLEKGSVFTDGYLHLYNQKGTQENPIIIDSYGNGNAPLIETNGQGVWYQDYGKQLDNQRHTYKGYVSSSILLYDSEFIEVKNIAMTNESLKVDNRYNALDTMNRTGVAVVTQNIGTADHIYLDGLDIKNVKGNVYDKHMNNGGIYFTVFQPKNENETGISRYNDILIQNCKLDTVNRWGIAVGYTAYHNHFTDALISDETIAKYGSSNVVIKNNYVKDAGGDAITTMYCDRPLIEYNVSDGIAKQINPNDYSETDFGRVAAGIWPWKCKNAVFQYNEAFDTCQNQDAQAWDADSGDGTLYQYNYSHNNAGGAVMFCLEQSVNNTFRYNISQNDLGGVINPTNNPDAHIYNNVFYIKENVPFIRSGMSGGNMVVENNIIYYSGNSPRQENWYNETDQNKVKYDNNLYYNYANTPANEQKPVKVSAGEQVFVNAGQGPTTPKSTVNSRDAFNGYKLSENSPAINAGKFIIDANGYPVDKDFFGNKVGIIPDIGAHETDTPEELTFDIYSYVYNVDLTSKTVNNIPKSTTVETLKNNIKYSNVLTVEVKRENATLNNNDTILSNDKLVLTSKTGQQQSATYTLNVKKEYVEYERNGWTATAGSEQSEEPASNALDGNKSTLWHTSWDGCAQQDVWIEIDMKQSQKIGMLRYVPRPDNGRPDGATNGNFLEYKVSVKADENSPWQEVAKGAWENNFEDKLAVFNEEVTARYVKIEGIKTASADTSKIFGSAAEIYLGYEKGNEVVDPTPQYDEYSRNGWTATAGSEQGEEPASNALDGIRETLWHTDWNGCNQTDVWIEIDMKKPQKVGMLRYVPRPNNGQPDGATNGNFLEYKVSVKADESSPWEEVAKGTWENNFEDKLAIFTKEINARYVKIEGIKTASADTSKIFGSASEIYLGYEVK